MGFRQSGGLWLVVLELAIYRLGLTDLGFSAWHPGFCGFRLQQAPSFDAGAFGSNSQHCGTPTAPQLQQSVVGLDRKLDAVCHSSFGCA